MQTLDQIHQKIIADPMNQAYSNKGVLPLYKASQEARLVIVGQAPGRKAEFSQLFWNDPSGDRLRDWMGVSREVFYQSDRIAHLPMDFYYPGKAKSGDQPPRKGFAEKWHPLLLDQMPQIESIILIGAYAQGYYLKDQRKRNLTETVRNYQAYLPRYFPLVHPSPLNGRWLKKNPWFEEEVIPQFRRLIQRHI
ncbi:uracil-DNA glycosylase family protein [Facklamia miroungae]|uniref:Uracil-DNA glycosylase n=1 Tax=Facklamia miroungae TaxID=120956 RepID=A0A1G7UX56_9LACT|nr:uracil-DNA glycosylase family protein [Facklamia miroungae]NKZ30150.1 uracil-DNA glycosylase family protein [Facklamia miroungae]SDG51851.1 Uracil-DNA glycosylase [Facklamia miroungae]